MRGAWARLGGVFAQVFQPPRNVPQHAEQHVHGGCLDVPPGVPSGERVQSEPEQASELGAESTARSAYRRAARSSDSCSATVNRAQGTAERRAYPIGSPESSLMP